MVANEQQHASIIHVFTFNLMYCSPNDRFPFRKLMESPFK